VRRDLRPPAWIIRLLVHQAGHDHEHSCQLIMIMLAISLRRIAELRTSG
jgi:hypothetical protein